MFQDTGKSHAFAPDRLARLIRRYVELQRPADLAAIELALQADHAANGGRGPLSFDLPERSSAAAQAGATPKRQRRHLRTGHDQARAT